MVAIAALFSIIMAVVMAADDSAPAFDLESIPILHSEGSHLPPWFPWATPMPFQRDALRFANLDWQPSETTWAVVQYDDRPLDDISLELVNRNKYYCQIHGYSFVYLNQAAADVPPYWAKVTAVSEILDLRFADTGGFIFKGVMWLDMDAVVYDLGRPLDAVGRADKAFICAPDPVGLASRFNAGVWIVRNIPAGRALMAAWFANYRPSDWTRSTDGRWSTASDWAGTNYEQGAFIDHVLPHHAASIDILPWEILQGVGPATPGAFALHLFSTGHALAMGLIAADTHAARVLRAKHAHGDAAAVPLRSLLTMKINLGGALLNLANREGDPARFRPLYDEGEAVLASALLLDPLCAPCADNLQKIRKNRSLRG